MRQTANDNGECEMKTLAMLKLCSGGVMIGEFESADSEGVTLTNPRIVTPQMTMQGYGLAFSEIVPFKLLTTKHVESVKVLRSQFFVKIDECDIVKEIADEYRSDISGIDIVSGVNADILKKDPPKGGIIL